MNPLPPLPQEKSQIQKDLWRIEDVIAGLSANKENFRILVESVKNPGERAIFLGVGVVEASAWSLGDGPWGGRAFMA